jgi:DNA-binding transcriptional ArsR family regulator
VKSNEVVAALAALAQEMRLAIFRELVKRGPEGYTPGNLIDKLGMPAPTLSFHLKELSRAQLVSSRREGRFRYYTADFDTMRGLIGFLTEKCCSLSDAACEDRCASAAQPKRRRA